MKANDTERVTRETRSDSFQQDALLAASPEMRYNESVERFRRTEYPNMDRGVYLDHGGATIYAKSLVTDFSDEMVTNLWGNPHSENLPAKLSGDMVDRIRVRALEFLGADPRHYDLVFAANATAAIKIVAESFRDLADRTVSKTFWYGYHSEVHSSILGIRELSVGSYHCFDNDSRVEQWLADPRGAVVNNADSNKLGLFAYPGQSNLSGRRLPRSWTGSVRRNSQLRNTYTLFDAAALAMTTSLSPLFSDLNTAPDFTCLSFYKIFGFPDLGALIVRRSSGHVLNLRKYFGGGTIAQVFPLNGDSHSSRKVPGLGDAESTWDIHDGLEDGTLPFHSILALGVAIKTHSRLYGSMEFISRHCSYLSRYLYSGLASLKYPNGSPLVEIYVDDPVVFGDPSRQGATIAFNVKNKEGYYVPWTSIESMANDAGVYIRAGGVCCPGGVLRALKYEGWEWSRMFSSGHSCGRNEIAVINGKPTGVVRASLGPMTTKADVHALLQFLHNTFTVSEDSLDSNNPSGCRYADDICGRSHCLEARQPTQPLICQPEEVSLGGGEGPG
ncbi:pyridoxal phosphate-dependent transferase [Emericellopsis atlantica]|uniref:Pyridoxal phosphate-dependent transferase n=1 Tax=Emericellopsis atlantica TaxID=2614577 RepID=A0A9P7ZD64_9HYPO|nr:pyridoxal phosphate-dependent transferase [Emericellopsis atlantica]KAG9249380.1 pyridoxal phosphate-dependent transferase [Emericellopsis atlantica]